MECQLSEATRKIRAAFNSGRQMTSAEANRVGGTVDSRKIISRLRRRGVPIRDRWENINGRRFKVYYLNK